MTVGAVEVYADADPTVVEVEGDFEARTLEVYVDGAPVAQLTPSPEVLVTEVVVRGEQGPPGQDGEPGQDGAGGGGVAAKPPLPSKTIHVPPQTGTGSRGYTVGTPIAVPFELERDSFVLTARVATNSSVAGAQSEIGIYDVDPAGPDVPRNLLLTTGAFNTSGGFTTAIGTFIGGAVTLLPAGYYFYGYISLGTTSANLTGPTLSATFPSRAVNTSIGANQAVSYLGAASQTSLPTSWGTATPQNRNNTGVGVPVIALTLA